MKKLILIISLFSITNAFGQITINNNTGNNIEVTYREFDTSTCSATNTIVTTIGPFGTYTAALSSGSTHFAGLDSKCINTGITQNQTITTPFVSTGTCSITPNGSSNCMFLIPCTVTWNEPPPGGVVTVEFN
jgi:hypothetical protein